MSSAFPARLFPTCCISLILQFRRSKLPILTLSALLFIYVLKFQLIVVGYHSIRIFHLQQFIHVILPVFLEIVAVFQSQISCVYKFLDLSPVLAMHLPLANHINAIRYHLDCMNLQLTLRSSEMPPS